MSSLIRWIGTSTTYVRIVAATILIFVVVVILVNAQTPLDDMSRLVQEFRVFVTSQPDLPVSARRELLIRVDTLDRQLALVKRDATLTDQITQLTSQIDAIAVEIATLKALHTPTPMPLPTPPPLPPPLPQPPLPPSLSPPSTTRRLLQHADLVYAGAFRVSDAFSFGGSVLAWNSVRDTLLLTGQGDSLGEVEVPGLAVGSVISFNTARTVTPPFDPFEGKRRHVSLERLPSSLGGAWVEHDALYLTSWVYYDASHVQKFSHFIRPLDFASRGQVQGPFATTAKQQAYVAGSFTAIPPEWQARLGGRLLNGLCCTPIIGRTSSGASAWLIEPTQIGLIDPIPVTPLVYYPITHVIDTPRGGWTGDNTYYNGSGSMGSSVWPVGTDTILFWGSTGLGEFCYGQGTNIRTLHKTPTGAQNGREIYCYDPTNPYKSQHAYPYVFRVWAYDAVDFESVKNGLKQPWDLLPYAWWDLDLPASHPQSIASLQGNNALGGVTYDPTTGRIFVAQIKADSPAQFSYPPVIHVFTIGPS